MPRRNQCMKVVRDFTYLAGTSWHTSQALQNYWHYQGIRCSLMLGILAFLDWSCIEQWRTSKILDSISSRKHHCLLYLDKQNGKRNKKTKLDQVATQHITLLSKNQLYEIRTMSYDNKIGITILLSSCKFYTHCKVFYKPRCPVIHFYGSICWQFPPSTFCKFHFCPLQPRLEFRIAMHYNKGLVLLMQDKWRLKRRKMNTH